MSSCQASKQKNKNFGKTKTTTKSRADCAAASLSQRRAEELGSASAGMSSIVRWQPPVDALMPFQVHLVAVQAIPAPAKRPPVTTLVCLTLHCLPLPGRGRRQAAVLPDGTSGNVS